MPKIIQWGNLHRATTFLARFRLPFLPEFGAMDEVGEAVRHAAEFRKGAVVSAPPGTGKTTAVEEVVQAFRAAEAERGTAHSGYRPRGIVTFCVQRFSDRREMIRALYTDEFGELDRRVIRAGDAALLDELVSAWLEEGVAVAVFDHAEHLPDQGVRVIEDLINRARHLDPKGDTTAVDDDGEVSDRRGIGVVLVGTPAVRDRLKLRHDWGERWSLDLRPRPPELGDLPEIYAAFLPAFAQQARGKGAAKWKKFVMDTLRPHYRPSFRFITTHVERYVTMYADSAEVEPTSLEAIGFDSELFAASLTHLAGVTQEIAA